jgi:1-acyl-sn-glycerol-3-phosphate acyltransferase
VKALRAPGAAARWRGAWRLGCAVLRALQGGLICAFVFPFLDQAARMRRVGRWSAQVLDAIGVDLRSAGAAQPAPVLLLANHVSWLDILVINALRPARFVSKADIGRWPLLGFMVACGGTLFIERERKRDALRVVHRVADALRDGATVAVFPEGTTGAGPRLLPLHANLLQAAIATAAPVQPVALRYADAAAPFSRAVEYLGPTSLLESVWRIACAERLTAHVTLLPPLDSAEAERRTLVASVQAALQAELDAAGEPGNGLPCDKHERG